MTINTPFYLIDETALLKNLKTINLVRQRAEVKCFLALKCFSSPAVFDLMRPYLDGTTASSVNELILGNTHFGGESHIFSVAYSDEDMVLIKEHASTVIMNSLGQLARFKHLIDKQRLGLRVNPEISTSAYALADPCIPFSRLGERSVLSIEQALPDISGLLFHVHCDNDDFNSFERVLNAIETKYGQLLHQLNWLSLGGGISFTHPHYPIDEFCNRLQKCSEQYNIQIYLEPGQAVMDYAGSLEVSVLDVVCNQKNIAIVDASIEAHLMDLLIYKLDASLDNQEGDYAYLIAGNSCLAGDVFGEYRFREPIKIGDRLSFKNAIAYNLGTKNWFNGLNMPSVVVKRLDGVLELYKKWGYDEYFLQL